MGHEFSLSVFTLEINGTPTVSLQARRYCEARHFFQKERLRADLTAATSHGVPSCDAGAKMRVRLATFTEADLYRKATKSFPSTKKFAVMYLVDRDR
jgi:hypothetical protein